MRKRLLLSKPFIFLGNLTIFLSNPLAFLYLHLRLPCSLPRAVYILVKMLRMPAMLLSTPVVLICNLAILLSKRQ
jgi:hypothetical protein